MKIEKIAICLLFKKSLIIPKEEEEVDKNRCMTWCRVGSFRTYTQLL